MSFINKFIPFGSPGEIEEGLPPDGGIIEIDINGIPQFAIVDGNGNVLGVAKTRRSARNVRRMLQEQGASNGN